MNLQEEKEKLDHDHKLQLKRICLDKFLIGVLVIVFGFVANMVIETFKSDLVQQRFLLENRLSALQEMRLAFSAVSKQSLAHAALDEKKDIGEYGKALDNFVNITNKSAMLFSDAFGVSVSHHMLMHAAIVNGSRTLKEDHFAFLFATFNDFDELTRRALWQETLDRPVEDKEQSFSINIWDSKKISEGEGYLLFDELWKKWQVSNK